MSAPKNNTYVEYCAMENLGGKTQIIDLKWSADTLGTLAPFFYY
jgi:hypothetical protein